MLVGQRRSRRPRVGLAAALLALPLLAGLTTEAVAQSTTLVSNTGQTHLNHTNGEKATAFTTGNNSAGYTISSVDIALGNFGASATTVVTIREVDGANPGDLVATLTNPTTLTANAVNTFTAPASTTLAANTTYFLVANDGRRSGGVGNVRVSRTSSHGQTGATGWTIADGSRFRNNLTGGTWAARTQVMRFAIKGAANTPPPPTVSISAGTSPVTEGTAASFTLSRTGPTTSALTVSVSVSEETAGGQDFVASGLEGNKDVIIPAGASSVDYTVATTPDSTDEPDGAVTVSLVSGTDYNRHITNRVATVTVNDDDAAALPVITITGGGAVTEGANAAFTVNANPAPAGNLTVNLTVTDAPNADFVANAAQGNQTVTISGGATSAAYNVPTAGGSGETTDEPDGPVTLAARDGAGYTHASASATVTVNDNDATTVTLFTTTPTATESPSGNGERGRFRLVLNRKLYAGETLVIPFGFTGGTLGTHFRLEKVNDVTGVAYDATTGTVTFTGSSGGSNANQHFWVIPEDDDDTDGETIGISVPASSATGTPRMTATGMGGGATGSGTVTITVTDDDTAPPPNAAPVFNPDTAARSVAENPGAGVNVGAPIPAATDADNDSLTYSMGGDDAASFDFNTSTRQITTKTGVTYDHEAKSSYTVTVTATDGTASDDMTVTITITDVNEPPIAPSAPAVTAAPGSTDGLDVSWSAPANTGKPAISSYDVRYRAGNSGAFTNGPQDVTGASASITGLTAGTSYEVQVRATNAEGDGSWSASGTGATAVTPTVLPAVTISGGSAVTEGTGAEFAVSRTGATTSALTVLLTVSENAAGGRDFVASGAQGNKQVVIPSGSASQTYTVPTSGDNNDEPNGAVTVAVRNSSNYTHASASATVTVNDNDATTVTLFTTTATATESPANTGERGRFRVVLNRALRDGEVLAIPFGFTGGTLGTDFRLEKVNDVTGVAYDATTGTVTFTGSSGGSNANQHFWVIPEDDDDTDGETIGISVPASSATGTPRMTATGMGGGATGSGTVTIAVTDDDTTPTLNTAPTVQNTIPNRPARAGTAFSYQFPANTFADADNDSLTYTAALSNGLDLPSWLSFNDDTRTFSGTPPAAAALTVRVTANDGNGGTVSDDFVITVAAAAAPSPNADPPARDPVAGLAVPSWLARFGRVAAERALDGVSARMAAPRMAGMRGSLAGQAISFAPAASARPAAGKSADSATMDTTSAASGAAPGMTSGIPAANREAAEAMADVARGLGASSPAGPAGEADPFGDNRFGAPPARSRTMTARDALLGSGFSLTGRRDGAGGSMAVWGRASQGSFDGKERGGGMRIRLDGEATAGTLGADYARGKWLIGLALTRSASEGKYAATATGGGPCPGTGEDPCDGKIEASLTAAVPYGAWRVSERMKLWGAAGHGTGEVTLKTAPGSGSGAGVGGRYHADISWTMAAAGGRGDLMEAPGEGSGPSLALTSDAFWARTSSDETRDLAASASDVTRLRLGLEGSWRMALAGGANLAPRLETGARHDGGDAETGFGVDAGGGIAWTDPTLGLSLDLSGRALVAHEDDGLKDRGFSAALAYDPDPGTNRGPSMSFRQDFGGRARGGLDALFAPDPLADRAGDGEAASRWSLEGAYGFPAFGGRFTGSPHIGLGLAAGSRDYSGGWRLTPEAANAPHVSFGVKATRRESERSMPEHRAGFEITARW